MDLLWIVLVFMIGFTVGAFFAFLLGKRFLSEKEKTLYERWKRREKIKQRAWSTKLSHDLKNPLFLIQAFTWTYLDKLKQQKASPSELKRTSKKMAETLNRQANKALGILKEASQKK
jgi:hypothetical protein